MLIVGRVGFDATVPPSVFSTPIDVIVLSHYHADHIHVSPSVPVTVPLNERLKLIWLPFVNDVANNLGTSILLRFISPTQLRQYAGVDAVYIVPSIHVPLSLHYLVVHNNVAILYHLDSRLPSPAILPSLLFLSSQPLLQQLLQKHRVKQLYVIFDAVYIGSGNHNTLNIPAISVDSPAKLQKLIGNGAVIFATATRVLDLLQLLAKWLPNRKFVVVSPLARKALTAMTLLPQSREERGWLRWLLRTLEVYWGAAIDAEVQRRIRWLQWSDAKTAIELAKRGEIVVVGNGFFTIDVAKNILDAAISSKIPVFVANTLLRSSIPSDVANKLQRHAAKLSNPLLRGHMDVDTVKLFVREVYKIADAVGIDAVYFVPIHCSDYAAALSFLSSIGADVLTPSVERGKLAIYNIAGIAKAIAYPPTPPKLMRHT